MTHMERYPGAPKIDMTDALARVRMNIPENPELKTPTREEVEQMVKKLFPNILSGEQEKIVIQFMESEEWAQGMSNQSSN